MNDIDDMQLIAKEAEQYRAVQKTSRPLAVWWAMIEAQEELCDTPIADETAVLTFMGSGASMNVTAGQLRAMFAAIFPEPAIPAQEAT